MGNVDPDNRYVHGFLVVNAWKKSAQAHFAYAALSLSRRFVCRMGNSPAIAVHPRYTAPLILTDVVFRDEPFANAYAREK